MEIFHDHGGMGMGMGGMGRWAAWGGWAWG